MTLVWEEEKDIKWITIFRCNYEFSSENPFFMHNSHNNVGNEENLQDLAPNVVLKLHDHILHCEIPMIAQPDCISATCVFQKMIIYM